MLIGADSLERKSCGGVLVESVVIAIAGKVLRYVLVLTLTPFFVSISTGAISKSNTPFLFASPQVC